MQKHHNCEEVDSSSSSSAAAFVNVRRHFICHISSRNLVKRSTKKVILLLVDCQNDFCDKNAGTLFVPGAEEDMERVAHFIKINKKYIDEIYCTMDTHHRQHIAHAIFWKDVTSGQAPKPFHRILHEDVGKQWIPKDPSLLDHCKYYTRQLENSTNPGKVQRFLTIWPEHCLVGTDGHAICNVINEALEEWTAERFDRDLQFVHKGMNCLTEMYSAIKADVQMETDKQTQENTKLLEYLGTAGIDPNSMLIICGEASSHCVNCTARDIIENWLTKNGDFGEQFKSIDSREKSDVLIKKTGRSEVVNLNLSNIYILRDGCSAVPGFEADADDFFDFCTHVGVNVCTTEALQTHIFLKDNIT